MKMRTFSQIGALMGLAVAQLAPGAATAQVQSPLQQLPGLNAKETNAEAVWMLRAGLNVAALQCQFSPFLQTVPTYNALLRQHSDEMADAFKSMTGYFVRTKGAKVGQRSFDTYATRTNQSWATFDGQVSFCEAAAKVGRRALAVPKGKLAEFATAELAAMRTSLSIHQTEPLRTLKLEWVTLPDINQFCGKKRC